MNYHYHLSVLFLLTIAFITSSCNKEEPNAPNTEPPIVAPNGNDSTVIRTSFRIIVKGEKGVLAGEYVINDVTHESATVETAITRLDPFNTIAEHGHCWSTTFPPTIQDKRTRFGERNVLGTVESQLLDLEPFTKYYVRLFAENADTLVYHPQVDSFYTAAWQVYNIDNSDIPENYIKKIVLDNGSFEEDNKLWLLSKTSRELIAFDTENSTWEVYSSRNSNTPFEVIEDITLLDDDLCITCELSGCFQTGIACLNTYQTNEGWKLFSNSSGKKVHIGGSHSRLVREISTFSLPSEVGRQFLAYDMTTEEVELIEFAKIKTGVEKYLTVIDEQEEYNIIDFSSAGRYIHFDKGHLYEDRDTLRILVEVSTLPFLSSKADFTTGFISAGNFEDIWLGSSEGAILTDSGFSSFDRINIPFIGYAKVNSIYEDYNFIIPENDRILFGTDKGLAVYTYTSFSFNNRAENWEIYTKENSGLPSNHITSIAVDNYNIIWLGTDKGLVKWRAN